MNSKHFSLACLPSSESFRWRKWNLSPPDKVEVATAENKAAQIAAVTTIPQEGLWLADMSTTKLRKRECNLNLSLSKVGDRPYATALRSTRWLESCFHGSGGFNIFFTIALRQCSSHTRVVAFKSIINEVHTSIVSRNGNDGCMIVNGNPMLTRHLHTVTRPASHALITTSQVHVGIVCAECAIKVYRYTCALTNYLVDDS